MAESMECGGWVLIAPTAVIHPSHRGNRFIIGEHSEIYDQVVIRFVGGGCDIIIGKFCYLNHGCVLCRATVYVSAITCSSPRALKLCPPTTHSHPARSRSAIRDSCHLRAGEDDVWVGANAVLLDGTHLEQGAIVAVGGVVSGRVPAFEV